MDAVPVLGCARHIDADGGCRRAQLGDEVLPLADPQVVQELGAAQAPERRGRQLLLLLAEVGPEAVVRHEVGVAVREAPVRGVRSIPVVGRTLAWVLDRQRGDDDQHLADDALVGGGEDHAGQARVQRQL